MKRHLSRFVPVLHWPQLAMLRPTHWNSFWNLTLLRCSTSREIQSPANEVLWFFPLKKNRFPLLSRHPVTLAKPPRVERHRTAGGAIPS
jgi:hypothetical protein